MTFIFETRPCPVCKGQPTSHDETCNRCGGDGIVLAHEEDSGEQKTIDEALADVLSQNDRDWRAKLDHVKAENAQLRALLDFQGVEVAGVIDVVYRQYRDRIEQLEAMLEHQAFGPFQADYVSQRRQIDVMAGALTVIATGDGVYGAQAHEYKQIALKALKEIGRVPTVGSMTAPTLSAEQEGGG